MAEIQMSNQHARPGVKKINKKNTKVDLTPMVDLGFLLLTFFVFTTTLSQSKAMGINVPKDSPNQTQVCNSCALTLIPVDNNRIFYFEGSAENHPEVKETSFSTEGIRKLILDKKRSVMTLNDPRKELVLAIKPGDASNYQNFVDIMDEVAINDVKHYFVAKPDPSDKKLLPSAWQ